MLKFKKFEGLVAAPFAPMDEKGHIRPEFIPEYYTFLERNGIAGAFINGSTGEGPSLTTMEKQAIASEWAACLKRGGKVRVINLVGGTSVPECIDNALFSHEEGLSAIAVVSPYYFRPDDSEQLASFVSAIGEAVPEMPVYFYHIPSLTGVGMPMAGFLSRIADRLPNFAGIKYTHEDFMDFLECLNFRGGAYDMLWGRDECLLPALALGCRGAVGSTYNYAAPLYHAIIDAFTSGDLELAAQLQQRAVKMIALLGKYGGIATGKAFMKFIGMDCGDFRLPVRNMDGKMYKQFAEEVKSLGMEEYFSKL
jgi:N-acetylneuraminate lyase